MCTHSKHLYSTSNSNSNHWYKIWFRKQKNTSFWRIKRWMPTDAKLFHNNIQIFQWYEKWFILIQFIYLVVFHQYRNIFGFPQSFGDKIVLIMFMLKFLNDLLRSIYFIFFLHQTNDLINLIILIKLLVWLSCFILQCALLHDDDIFFRFQFI